VRFPNGHVPSRASEIAVLAIKSYAVFMDTPEDTAATSDIVNACRDFDARAARRA
jgi:hypothetical protein